jgi:hypothetical protein
MLTRSLFDCWLVAFWSFVCWCGGPLHPSYGYSKLQWFLARERLRHFLHGGD